MSYAMYAVSIIVILILGLIVKEEAIKPSVKIILCVIVGLVTYCALNTSKTEGFARGGGKRKRKKKKADAVPVVPVVPKYTIRGNGMVPSGTIVMWRGSKAPEGWEFCDGKEGRPDLQGKFILGANAEKKIDEIGGNNMISLFPHHLPDHKHAYWDTLYQEAWGLENRALKTNQNKIDKRGSNGAAQDDDNWPVGSIRETERCLDCNQTNREETTIGDQSTITVTTRGKPFDIMPPYYVLAYIIKL